VGGDGTDCARIHDDAGVPGDTLGVIGDFYIDMNNQDLYGPKTDSGWGDASNLNGEDGQDGADGLDGENGSQIHAGTGVPDASVGEVGDYYLDQTNKDLYGPKMDSGWGTPINLNGEDGQDGADGSNGSQIHSGTGAPDASVGVLGDYYLDKSNYDLYGPKVQLNKVNNGGWGSPLNLKGADGNANVTRYIFSGHDFTDFYMRIPTIPEFNDSPEESAWIVYLKQNTWMDHLPGWSTNGNSQYSVSHVRDSSLNLMFYIILQSGSGEVYDNIYVIRIESSETTNMTKQKSQNILPDNLDTSDYNAVAEYYGFYLQ
jgi:hypothetical protein